MADRGRITAYRSAGSSGRTSRPHTSAGTRHCATRRPGSVQARTQAAGLAVRGPDGCDGRRYCHAGRDARARTVVATRWPVVSGQSWASHRDADGRQWWRPGPDTRHVCIADRGQARATRLLGRR